MFGGGGGESQGKVQSHTNIKRRIPNWGPPSSPPPMTYIKQNVQPL